MVRKAHSRHGPLCLRKRRWIIQLAEWHRRRGLQPVLLVIRGTLLVTFHTVERVDVSTMLAEVLFTLVQHGTVNENQGA